MYPSFQCARKCRNFARDPLFKLTNQHHPVDKHGRVHWENALDTSTRERGSPVEAGAGARQGREPCGSESLRAVGEETDVLRQSHKSVFVAKLEKYVRKQIAAKRRRREGAEQEAAQLKSAPCNS